MLPNGCRNTYRMRLIIAVLKVFRKSISSLDSCVNIKLTKQEDSLLPISSQV